jgi:predicted GIY-YIG superfamily endonuclease
MKYYVYILKAANFDVCKFGITKDVLRRAANLHREGIRGFDFKLSVIKTVLSSKVARSLENKIKNEITCGPEFCPCWNKINEYTEFLHGSVGWSEWFPFSEMEKAKQIILKFDGSKKIKSLETHIAPQRDDLEYLWKHGYDKWLCKLDRYL